MNPCRTPPADAGPDSDFSRGAPHLSGDPPPTPTFPPACDFACSYPRPSYRQGEGAPLRLPDRASHRKQLARRSNPEQKSRRKGVWFSRTHQNPPLRSKQKPFPSTYRGSRIQGPRLESHLNTVMDSPPCKGNDYFWSHAQYPVLGRARSPLPREPGEVPLPPPPPGSRSRGRRPPPCL